MSRPPRRLSRHEGAARGTRRIIRVLAEGKVTEPDYIESWVRRNRGVRLDIDKDALADQTAYVDRHTIQHRARQLGLVDGKSIPDSERCRLFDGYEEAKRRAQALDFMHERDGREPGANPSSGVWRLIDSIRRESLPD